ncbi:MATE family efflux transporter [Tenacibaculum sp. MAR_2010_89]|uniref:MATE family efflux transporter n=1 Tax=Tenacibaculum sp. MAR_2010_89 TaxID=1250198 RepID=UPI000B85BFA0|nr:MATE family efflux transporter [Tenacibaculum sp. MAR_2010_89]
MSGINKTMRGDNFTYKIIKVIFFRVLGVCLLFGLTLFLTNNYEAKIVGKYDFVRSFILVIGSLCLLGTDHSILYFSGKLKSKGKLTEIKNIYFRMMKIILITSIIVAIVIIVAKQLIITFFEDQSTYVLILSGVCVLFFYCLTILNTEFFRALDLIIVSEIFRNVIKYVPFFLSAIILFLINKEEYLITFFLLSFVLVGFISTILSFLKIKELEDISNYKKEINVFTKEIFLASYPMAISSMGFFLLLSIDIIFLKKYRSDEIVAYYSVAVKFVLILSMIINTVNINISSKIAELFKSKRFLELENLLKKSSRLIFFLSLPLILMIVFFSEDILFLFGNNYKSSNRALLIMVVSQGICTLFGSVNVYLNMTGKQKYFQNILICSVVINFILNRILIPVYGMEGAAIAFSCSLFFWNILATIVVYKKDSLKVFIR